MSYLNVSEPRTTGKVIINTTKGPIEVELWSKECPKACRNFVQLCMDRYYDNTIFHRVVKDFIVQGGDPTNTGTGGESIWKRGFPIEIHPRLRFNRRGLLGVAKDENGINGSQFFFTLSKAEELNNKETLFGKVTGNSLFNLLSIGDLETDNDDRPLYPTRILNVDIVHNPFDEMDMSIQITTNKDVKTAPITKKKFESKLMSVRSKHLVSFEDDLTGEQDITHITKKYRSSFDLVKPDKPNETVSNDIINSDINVKPSSKQESNAQASNKNTINIEVDSESPNVDSEGIEVNGESNAAHKIDNEKELKKQIKDIKNNLRELRDNMKAIEIKNDDFQNSQEHSDSKGNSSNEEHNKEEPRKLKSLGLLRRLHEDFKGKIFNKHTSKNNDDMVLLMLDKFKNTLHTKNVNKDTKTNFNTQRSPNNYHNDEDLTCKIHFIANCESCSKYLDNEHSDSDDNWMCMPLNFKAEVSANVYEPNITDYTVLDPRDADIDNFKPKEKIKDNSDNIRKYQSTKHDIHRATSISRHPGSYNTQTRDQNDKKQYKSRYSQYR